MGRTDNAYDNPLMKFCFSRFEAELMQAGVIKNKADAQIEIAAYRGRYYKEVSTFKVIRGAFINIFYQVFTLGLPAT